MPRTLGVCFKSVSLLEILVFKNKRKNYCLVAYIYNNIENEKFFELKSGGYRDGIKRKETR